MQEVGAVYVARRVEGERDEAHLAVQRGRIDDRLLERVENAVGQRAAVGIAARGVDEAEYRDLAARVAREWRALAVESDDLPVRRGHDPVEHVAAGLRRLELERRQQLEMVRRRGLRGEAESGGGDEAAAQVPASAFEPSFMWCARPSFSFVKSTSNFCVSSLPFQAKPRRNCSLSAPPLSQLARSDEVMYRRRPSQLCEIMLTCLPVAFS